MGRKCREMNPYLKNLNRIEFVVTLACTGRCKHCSEGDHKGSGEHLDSEAAADVVRRIGGSFAIESVMSFGGEPLLYPEVVSGIHRAAKEMGIPKRQLITNGFFAREPERIRQAAELILESGVNDILVSVDAFHQETIPLEPVRLFAEAVRTEGVKLRTQPAWLVSEEDDNPYNVRTRQILKEFERTGIASSSGNVIFPSGNALKYLREYFDHCEPPTNPYEEDPMDVRAISISPNGDTTLGGNVYRTDILEIIEGYAP